MPAAANRTSTPVMMMSSASTTTNYKHRYIFRVSDAWVLHFPEIMYKQKRERHMQEQEHAKKGTLMHALLV